MRSPNVERNYRIHLILPGLISITLFCCCIMLCFIIFCLSFYCSQELGLINNKSAVLSGVASLEYTSIPVATMVSVITLVLTGQSLTPVNVFTLVCFIGILRVTISYHMANGLLEMYDAYASLARIEEFLLSDENLSLNCFDQDFNSDSEKDKSLLAKFKKK